MEGKAKTWSKGVFFKAVPLEFLYFYVNDFSSFKIKKGKKSHKNMIN